MKVKRIPKLENKGIRFIKLMGNFECLYDLLLFDTNLICFKIKYFALLKKIVLKGIVVLIVVT
jgi:hypothetical protein